MQGIKSSTQVEFILDDTKTFLVQGAEVVKVEYCADEGEPIKMRLSFKESQPVGPLHVENRIAEDGWMDIVFSNFIDAGNSAPWRVGTTDDGLHDIHLFFQIEKLGSDVSESINVIRRITLSFYRKAHEETLPATHVESN